MNFLIQNAVRKSLLRNKLWHLKHPACIDPSSFSAVMLHWQFCATERPLSTYTPKMKENLSKMNALLPTIIDHVTESTEDIFTRTPQMKEKLREIMSYNISGGKMVRSMVFLMMYEKLTNKNIDDVEESILYLAWCIEMFLGYVLILDDMVDGAPYRRGKSSWYFKSNRNLVVMYDALLLNDIMYTLLKKFFRNHEYYTEMIETFHTTHVRTNYGQIMDCTKVSLTELSSLEDQFYEMIAINKTAYSAYYLPIILALYASKHFTLQKEKMVEELSAKLGQIVQMQDDYLDCYGDSNITGKECTDITGGKRTWLLLEAIKRCDANQFEKLKENYGRDDPDKVRIIRAIYDELDLKNKFKEAEEDFSKSVEEDIGKLADPALRYIFSSISLMMTGRDK